MSVGALYGTFLTRTQVCGRIQMADKLNLPDCHAENVKSSPYPAESDRDAISLPLKFHASAGYRHHWTEYLSYSEQYASLMRLWRGVFFF